MSAPAPDRDRARPLIGVLALQGDVREHVHALERAGAEVIAVRRPTELAAVDGLVIPGGESTTIDKLLRIFELYEPLQERLAGGMAALGSCAGMILLADRLVDSAPGQRTLGGIDMTVERNAFGRQVDSFEADLPVAGIDGGPVRAVFIRAPRVVDTGPAVEVLSRFGDTIVAVRQGRLVATAFHPEITGDDRVHEFFVDLVRRTPTPGDGSRGRRV